MTVVDARKRVAGTIGAVRSYLARRIQSPRGARPPKLPVPPRYVPAAKPPLVLTPGERLARASLAIVGALVVGFLGDIMVISHVQHTVAQQQLGDEFRLELRDGTAPVDEGTVDDVLLSDGDPVAYLNIPVLGINEIVVEGTNSGTLHAGPGHRRDTVLPGQIGTSVLMGRATAFGGPFGRIQELQPGQRFTVVTGQGLMTFEVLGVRYAGDPAPTEPKDGESRLILETARGAPYVPSGIARVDARLTSEPQPAGVRQTTPISLPREDLELEGDSSTAWALVFALQLFLVIEILAVWAFRRVGPRKTWVVFVPAILFGGLLAADQVTLLLPNLL